MHALPKMNLLVSLFLSTITYIIHVPKIAYLNIHELVGGTWKEWREVQHLQGSAQVTLRNIFYTLGIKYDPKYPESEKYAREAWLIMQSIGGLVRSPDLEASKVRIYCDDDARWIKPAPAEVSGRRDKNGLLPKNALFSKALGDRVQTDHHLYFDIEQNLDGSQPWRSVRGTPPCRQGRFSVEKELGYLRLIRETSGDKYEVVLCRYLFTTTGASSFKRLRHQWGLGAPLSLARNEVLSLSFMTSLFLLRILVEGQLTRRRPNVPNEDGKTWQDIILRPQETSANSPLSYAYFGLLSYLADFGVELSEDDNQARAGTLVDVNNR
ncbi:hypothetical protein EJ05DRAFT_516322 [Pseudovirgaria hyperparasitica]|uniref:Uncharacterized protein n=1 Tax=Pseudovirgaria hyperparasitica TaxID=470096 RepID=A0A6A6WL10_9PEZI|nr:uncharacterized protein EJ05DRAFT_516322 [Pseudovirgaria hyperparasitica]KAF2762866.1 hypothetical protein EJ05DRAFT_516322 [Pseudovirgaria hyperparasitica]